MYLCCVDDGGFIAPIKSSPHIENGFTFVIGCNGIAGFFSRVAATSVAGLHMLICIFKNSRPIILGSQDLVCGCLVSSVTYSKFGVEVFYDSFHLIIPHTSEVDPLMIPPIKD